MHAEAEVTFLFLFSNSPSLTLLHDHRVLFALFKIQTHYGDLNETKISSIGSHAAAFGPWLSVLFGGDDGTSGRWSLTGGSRNWGRALRFYSCTLYFHFPLCFLSVFRDIICQLPDPTSLPPSPLWTLALEL